MTKGNTIMKKNLAILLAALAVFTVLTACSRRDQYRDPVESENHPNQPIDSDIGSNQTPGSDIFDSTEGTTNNSPDTPTIKARPYEGLTADDLLALYQSTGSIYGEPSKNMINTPYYLIASSCYGGLAYSKLTGEFVSLCKDPICKHQDCIFRNNIMILDYMVSDQRIYLLLNYITSQDLYSFDFMMNDARKEASWTAEDLPENLHLYNGKVYYSGFYLHESEPEYTTFVLDLASGTSSPLWGTERFTGMYGGCGPKIYYTSQNAIYSYDLDAKKDTCLVPASVLNAANGEIALYFRYATEKTLSYAVLSTVSGTSNYEMDLETGEISLCAKQNDTRTNQVVRLGDHFYFFIRHDTEDYKDDKHYDYYIKQPEEALGKANPSGGELWRCPITGGEAELVTYLSTDEIPDNIESIYTFDGKYVIVKYSTYQDYYNEYNTSFNPFDRNTKQYIRLALIDVATGEVYTVASEWSGM